MNFWSIFITGLFAGGLTCLAVQGGLLASSIAQQREEELSEDAQKTNEYLPVLAFLTTRLIAYTALGALLGLLGSVAQLSLQLRAILQFLVALFMIGTALNLLQVHPIFRYFILQPPKSLARLVRNQSRSKNVFGPAILGAFTVLIPCGATQAMMAYAITTGSPINGAVTMGIFILGTSPLFFLLGYAAKKLGTMFQSGFNKLAAVAIILIALYNINGAIALSGSSLTFENILTRINCTISFCSPSDALANSEAVNEATVYITQSGYKLDPGVVSLKAGSSVKLNLINQSAGGCIQEFTIPKLGIQKTVTMGDTQSITFTAPNTKGPLPFMCSMGMYRGVFNVI